MGRRGFTVVEVLVVIGITGVLIALLVPAVQYARESARRTQCIARLSQIGKAIHGFESTRGHLPSNDIWPETGVRLGSPHVQILPWLEQSALEQSGRLDRGAGPLDSTWDGAPRLPVFLCPSDGGAGKSNYAYCVGWQVVHHPEFHADAAGAFSGNDPPVRLRDVTDGLSQTAAASERLMGSWSLDSFDPRRDLAYSGLELIVPPSQITPEMMRDACQSLRPEEHFNPFTGRSWTHLSYLGAWYNHAFPPNAPLPPCAAHQEWPITSAPTYGPFRGVFPASSEHNGLANVLLLDGSVRGCSDHVDTGVWRAIASRAGGETDSDF